MDKYLKEIELEMEQQNIPTDLRYEIITSLINFTENNHEDEIIEMLGEPQKFIADYLKYGAKSQDVNYPFLIDDSNSINDNNVPESSTKNYELPTNNIEITNSKKPITNTNNRFDAAHNKLFQIVYYWLLIFPFKLVGFFVIFICLFASVAIYFSPLSSQDLNIALIVLNISIYLIYSSFLALIKLIRDFINHYLLGGK